MLKTLDWVGAFAAVWAVIRFFIFPLLVRLMGSMALYVATKLGEQVAIDYLHQHVPLFRKHK